MGLYERPDGTRRCTPAVLGATADNGDIPCFGQRRPHFFCSGSSRKTAPSSSKTRGGMVTGTSFLFNHWHKPGWVWSTASSIHPARSADWPHVPCLAPAPCIPESNSWLDETGRGGGAFGYGYGHVSVRVCGDAPDFCSAGDRGIIFCVTYFSLSVNYVNSMDEFL